MCQNTAFTFRFLHSFTTNTSTASRSSQLKSTDHFQNPLHNNVCRTPLHTERSLHKKRRRRPQKDTQFWFFFAVNVQYGLPTRPNLRVERFLPVHDIVVHPEMHLYSRKGLNNIAGKNLFPRPALLPHLSSGVTGVYHTKKSCLQYVQSTPTPTPRYKNFPPSRIFLIEFSLCPVGLTARGKNTWRSFAWFICGRKRGGASYDTNSQCGRCAPSETTTELCRVGYLQGGLVLQLYSQLWTCSGVGSAKTWLTTSFWEAR